MCIQSYRIPLLLISCFVGKGDKLLKLTANQSGEGENVYGMHIYLEVRRPIQQWHLHPSRSDPTIRSTKRLPKALCHHGTIVIPKLSQEPTGMSEGG